MAIDAITKTRRAEAKKNRKLDRRAATSEAGSGATDDNDDDDGSGSDTSSRSGTQHSDNDELVRTAATRPQGRATAPPLPAAAVPPAPQITTVRLHDQPRDDGAGEDDDGRGDVRGGPPVAEFACESPEPCVFSVLISG